MKVFISWSGEASYKVAASLADWLPNVIQRAEPFLSSGIPKGVRWSEAIARELEQTCFGIICVTEQNVEAPWLLFEAGAISTTLSQTFVAPLLVGVGKDKLAGSPLSQFQMTNLEHEEIFKLIKSLNDSDKERHLDENRLKVAFDAFWPLFQQRVKDLVAVDTTSPVGSNSSLLSLQVSEPPPAETPLELSKTDFEAAVTEFQKTKPFSDEQEFWIAAFADKRHDLGLPQVGVSLEDMSEAVPKVFWPHYFLARRALASQDISGARDIVERLPPPQTPREVKSLTDITLDLTDDAKTYKGSLEQLKQLLSSDLEDTAKASAIERFAARPDDAHGSLAVALLREAATRFNPSDTVVRFNLARQLGDHRGLHSVSYFQYEELTKRLKGYEPAAANNIALLCTSRGLSALAYQYYDKALQGGNEIARANIASNLVSFGYLKGAGEILETASGSEATKPNIAAAKDKREKAHRKTDQDAVALRKSAKHDQGDFAHFASVCIRAWTSGAQLSQCQYVAGEGKLIITLSDSNIPKARLLDGEKSLFSDLTYNGVCYEGAFHEENLQPNTLSRRILFSPSNEKADAALALIYGGMLATQETEQVFLSRKE